MEQYLIHLPYFLFFVFFGIIVNFANKDKKLTFKRAAREFIGAIWISLIIFAILDEFFDVSFFLIYVACSLAGYGNSKIIDFLDKDFFEFLILQGKQAVKNLVGKLKNSKNNNSNSYPEFPFPEDDITNDENENK